MPLGVYLMLALSLIQSPPPREAVALVQSAVAALEAGQSEVARRHLVDALKKEPSLTPASVLLGELLYRAGDLAGAIDVYQRALAYAPDQKVLAAKLEAWRKEQALHDRFGQKLGDHFTVLFEGPAEEALARKAVEVLEAAYWRIGSALYTYPADVITVVLYTREQFRDVTQSPDWAGGAYDGRIRMPVRGALENLREFERVLSHEFTHALVRSLAPTGVPQWLDEGLAMNFEGSPLAPQLAAYETAVTRPPLTSLERSFGGLDRKQATLAYATSGAAVKLLLEEAGAAGVVGLLTELGRGTRFAEAFERQTNMKYDDFARRVSAR